MSLIRGETLRMSKSDIIFLLIISVLCAAILFILYLWKQDVSSMMQDIMELEHELTVTKAMLHAIEEGLNGKW